MTVGTQKDFLDALKSSQIFNPTEFEEISTELQVKFSSSEELSHELLRRGWLTPFQIDQILEGKGDHLVLGQYVLLERLGEGGMGEVFKARHRRMDRMVALKVIRPDRLSGASAVNRFNREIKAASALSHPNVVIAYDADEVGGTHFFVMEYVEGVDLARLVRQRGPLQIRAACDYIRQASWGLQHAFERGLVHRDIKPSNLVVTLTTEDTLTLDRLAEPRSGSNPKLEQEAVVKILDMGLARLNHAVHDHLTAITHEGAVMGTPDYMAPEQATDSHSVDIRGDIYSLGCSLYYLLTGQPPFPTGTMLEKLFNHRFQDAPPVEILRPDVPPEVSAVLSRMLAKQPALRFQTPAEVAQALEPFSKGGNRVSGLVPIKQIREIVKDRISSSDLSQKTKSVLAANRSGAAPTMVPQSSALQETILPLSAITSTDQLIKEQKTSAARLRTSGKRGVGWSTSVLIALLGIGAGGGMAVMWHFISAGVNHGEPLTQVDLHSSVATRASTERKVSAAVATVPLNSKKSLVEAPKTPRTTDSPKAKFAGKEGESIPTKMSSDSRITKIEKPKPPLKPPAPSPVLLEHVGYVGTVGSHQRDVTSLAFLNQGRWVASGSTDYKVRVWDVKQDNRLAAEWDHENNVFALAGFENMLIFGGGDFRGKETTSNKGRVINFNIYEWDFKSDRIFEEPFSLRSQINNPKNRHTESVRSVAISSDGKMFLTGGTDQFIRIWFKNGLQLKPFDAQFRVMTVAFSSDGTRVLGGGWDKAIKVWDLENRQGICTFSEHTTQPINVVATSPTNPRLTLSASADQVFLWDNTTGEKLPPYHLKHEGEVFAAAFSRDGKRILTGCADKKIHLWDTVTGMEIAKDKFEPRPQACHQTAITAVAISPDGSQAVSGSLDGAILLWSLPRP